MTAPAFVRFSLHIDAAQYDCAVSVLLELPTAGWQESDEDGALVFWLAVKLLDDASVGDALNRLRALGRLQPVSERTDWQAGWRRFHHPVDVGRLRIRPPWESPRPGALDVVIDVGMAFGTGSHATTRQCLAALQELEPSSLLDLGTGSGVLALAALRLGFAPVYGCDCDELALQAASGNALLNGLRPEYFHADVSDESVKLPVTEVVVLNIALRPIVAFGTRLSAAADCGGLLPRYAILAGLLVPQADEARAAYPGYAERARLQQDKWVLLHLERR